jgi:hypothetical protein
MAKVTVTARQHFYEHGGTLLGYTGCSWELQSTYENVNKKYRNIIMDEFVLARQAFALGRRIEFRPKSYKFATWFTHADKEPLWDDEYEYRGKVYDEEVLFDEVCEE